MAKMRFGTGASRKVVVLEYYRYKPETVYTYMAFKNFYVKTVNFSVFPGIEYILFPNYSG